MTECPSGEPPDVWEIELIASELGPLVEGKQFVVGGDLNCVLLFDEIYRRTSNAQLFSHLAEAGFCDVRKRFFDAEQQTFFRADSAPYQLDHVFADAKTAEDATVWKVLVDGATGDAPLSDHAPIEIVLDQPAAATRPVRPADAHPEMAATRRRLER